MVAQLVEEWTGEFVQQSMQPNSLPKDLEMLAAESLVVVRSMVIQH